MGMVNRKRIRLLTAWVLAAVLSMAIGSDALAATGSKVWGRRSLGLGARSAPSLSTQQARKPGIRAYSGEPDVPGKNTGNPSETQLPYWQQVILGLVPLLGSQRLP
jgi:hypothetical protein